MIHPILIISITVIVIVLSIVTISKAKRKKACLYYHHECPSYFGPHGDSLSVFFIKQSNGISQQLIDPNQPEWEIIERIKSDPEGSCGEYIKITERRNNQSKWEYHICWINSFEWLMQFDLPRILSDKSFFNEYLLKADSGDPHAQTLIGSLYAHCLELAKPVLSCDEKKALFWWNKAAKQGHRYAMRELAIYYLSKEDIEKAIEWNDKGKCCISLIERQKHSRKS